MITLTRTPPPFPIPAAPRARISASPVPLGVGSCSEVLSGHYDRYRVDTLIASPYTAGRMEGAYDPAD